MENLTDYKGYFLEQTKLEILSSHFLTPIMMSDIYIASK